MFVFNKSGLLTQMEIERLIHLLDRRISGLETAVGAFDRLADVEEFLLARTTPSETENHCRRLSSRSIAGSHFGHFDLIVLYPKNIPSFISGDNRKLEMAFVLYHEIAHRTQFVFEKGLYYSAGKEWKEKDANAKAKAWLSENILEIGRILGIENLSWISEREEMCG